MDGGQAGCRQVSPGLALGGLASHGRNLSLEVGDLTQTPSFLKECVYLHS